MSNSTLHGAINVNLFLFNCAFKKTFESDFWLYNIFTTIFCLTNFITKDANHDVLRGSDTVECRYNTVQFIMRLHTTPWQQQQNLGEIWGVCYEIFKENWPCYNGTALYNCWGSRQVNLNNGQVDLNTHPSVRTQTLLTPDIKYENTKWFARII